MTWYPNTYLYRESLKKPGLSMFLTKFSKVLFCSNFKIVQKYFFSLKKIRETKFILKICWKNVYSIVLQNVIQ